VTFDDLPTLTLDVNRPARDVQLQQSTIDVLDDVHARLHGTDHGPAQGDLRLDACIEFAGWTGSCSGTSTTCNVTVSSNVTVGALFDRKPNCIPQ